MDERAWQNKSLKVCPNFPNLWATRIMSSLTVPFALAAAGRFDLRAAIL